MKSVSEQTRSSKKATVIADEDPDFLRYFGDAFKPNAKKPRAKSSPRQAKRFSSQRGKS